MTVRQGDFMLRVEHLTRRFGGFTAIDDISLGIEEGEMHCIIGPNGAGKTTLFNLITAKLKPDSGRIFLRDRDITDLTTEEICHLGIGRKFQAPSIFTHLTVIENILVAGYGKYGFSHLLFRGVQERDRALAMEILRKIELDSKRDHLASSLSHGERQWLEIGMLLRNEPDLLLLDEPTAGMTPAETRETAYLIRDNLSDLTTVVIEHDLKFLREIAEEVTVLHNGRILATGRFDEIENNEEVRKVYLGRE
ncbi:MAG: ABC transporter ATP-binding protein [Deltaproteobacteria bacterium]|nr:ABC transporter ATP-binding protein [Deltaproteobacteria bacterium]MBW2120279.1 ABC transporter ATP-binding protein [Deltaproteobacteria bacterium]